MTVANAIMENGTYNLTSIISADIIEHPTSWLYNFNAQLGGFMFVAFLTVFAIVLFLLAKNLGDVKDTQSAVYSLLITSIIATMLFFIEVDGAKLLSFAQLMFFLAGLGLSVLADRIIRNY